MVEFPNSTNYTNFTDTIKNNTQNNISLNIDKYMKKGSIFTWGDFVILLIDIFMVIGPSLGYFLQSLKFKKTKSSKGFSKSICLIIYTSQILRVFFWIGKPFKITLLYQSILIICFQVYLIYLWIKYHKTDNDLKYNDKKDIIEYIIDWSDTISPNKIWNWSNTIEYYKFMFLIIIFLLLICGVVGIHNTILVNIIGTISVISEASTLIPQIIISCKKKNASNLSMSMVALWFIGDSCKFVYNIIYKTPIQMIASGGLQIFLDFFSLMQIICYRDNSNIHYRSTEETNVTIPNFTNFNSQKVQQINQFMNKLEERYSEEIEGNKNSKREENENPSDKNDSKKIINKVEVHEKIENSDQVEVLDKSKHENIHENSDEEEEENKNDNINNINAETVENLNDKEKQNENNDENKNEKDKEN